MENTTYLHRIIADNIKKERIRLKISQEQLAEKADISVDTVKSVERGIRSMSLDTYLRIVQALETTPTALVNPTQQGTDYAERFLFMTRKRSNKEVEFVLHMVEQLLKGQDCYLAG